MQWLEGHQITGMCGVCERPRIGGGGGGGEHRREKEEKEKRLQQRQQFWNLSSALLRAQSLLSMLCACELSLSLSAGRSVPPPPFIYWFCSRELYFMCWCCCNRGGRIWLPPVGNAKSVNVPPFSLCSPCVALPFLYDPRGLTDSSPTV